MSIARHVMVTFDPQAEPFLPLEVVQRLSPGLTICMNGTDVTVQSSSENCLVVCPYIEELDTLDTTDVAARTDFRAWNWYDVHTIHIY
jgi:hypothetical protein